MDDYNSIIENVQTEVGRNYLGSPDMLNIPGRSLACKIDPFYYLAMPRALMDCLGGWTGILPDKICTALIRTGNMLSSEKDRNYIVSLKLIYPGSHPGRPVDCCLLDAGFMDRSLAIYAGRSEPLPVSSLRIHLSDKDKMDTFLNGKTNLLALAFSD